jgi:Ribbon-helix-helix protein, copG family
MLTCDERLVMHFNIYLDDETGQRLTAAAKERGENRNAVIRQAVQEWLRRDGMAAWPAVVLSHGGDAKMPAFETGREQLGSPSADPLA